MPTLFRGRRGIEMLPPIALSALSLTTDVQGVNSHLHLSDEGTRLLLFDEAVVNGLYNDSVGLATYGVGHLVHARRLALGSLLYGTARANRSRWQQYFARERGTPFLHRRVAGDPAFSTLQAGARVLGRERLAEKRYNRAYATLRASQRLDVDVLADQAVALETRLLGEDPLRLFRSKVPEYEDSVRQAIRTPLTQREYDALVSFAYNTGAQGFHMTSVAGLVNEGRYKSTNAAERAAAIDAIAGAFAAYNKARRGTLLVIQPGLVTRRRREADHFLLEARTMSAPAGAGRGPQR
ncbi:MAG: hypothetical protein MUF00_17670 [Gemmatimonadaceae bacterium]|nr:hypothetical protein [Gemmatimonadaceae bacterium]